MNDSNNKSQDIIKIPETVVIVNPRKKSRAFNKNMQVRPDTDVMIKRNAKKSNKTIDEVLYKSMVIYESLKSKGVID